MRVKIIIYKIHVAGTWTKKPGIDGLFRGDFLEGVTTLKYILEMLPLDVGALDRAGGIDQWIRYWWVYQQLIKLDHVHWFTQGNGSEGYMWFPTLDEMETSMDMITEAIHNSSYLLHVIVCPLLMTHLWRKALSKGANYMFAIPTGLPVFTNIFNEPLCIVLVLTIIKRSNWS